MLEPCVEAFFDPCTSTFSYVVHDPKTRACAVIDSVLDYDAANARTTTTSAQKIVDYINKHQLHVEWLLETHAHADHLSAASWLQSQVGGRIAIGEPISLVQQHFKKVYNLGTYSADQQSNFDVLLKVGQHFTIGELSVCVLHVPGHTPADMAYHIDGLGIFIGDTLFMPDVGTARCDFPGGDAHQLYQSIKKILAFPEDTVLYLCHDYPPAGRQPQFRCTVGAQRAKNIHIHDGVSEDEFVAMRQARDATLGLPRLMLPALQVNIQAGQLPQPESNGKRYLKIPLNLF